MKASTYHDITDQELLEKFYTDRNNEWLGILLQRYTLLLLGVSMKYLKNEEEAKDSVQQIFLKVIQELQKYKVVYFKSWLYMVAKNHCLMKLRKAGLSVEFPEVMPHTPQYDDDFEDFENKEKLIQLLENNMNHLKNEQRLCVELFYLQEKSYKEIVRETGFSLNEIKSHIQNGKLNLKKMMTK